jgi:hypothetical protein
MEMKETVKEEKDRNYKQGKRWGKYEMKTDNRRM